MRVRASMSCTSHSTPSVGPGEGLQPIVMTTSRWRELRKERGGATNDFPLPGIEPYPDRHYPPYCPVPAGLRKVRRLVDSPDLAQRVTDLAEGGPGAERVPDGRQDVVLAFRGRLERADPLADGQLVAVPPELPQPLRLRLLDPGIDAQRLVRLLLVPGELVHPDDDPRAVVGLLRHLVGGALDLGLLEAA